MLKEMASPIGRPPKYKTAQALWDKFVEYVEHVDANPWKTVVKGKSQRSANDAGAKAMSQSEQLLRRPYLLREFQLYAGIYDWRVYKANNEHRPGFRTVLRAIELACESNQVSGAIVGEFKENIVARLNGIVDRQEVTGKDGQPLMQQPRELTREEAQELIRKLNEET